MAVFFLCATDLAAADVPAEAEKTMQKFYTVFSGSNAEAMTPFLADEILFVGEAEIEDSGDRQIVVKIQKIQGTDKLS